MDFKGAQSLIGAINRMAKKAANAPAWEEAEVANYEKSLPSLQFRSNRVFERQAELDKLRDEMAQVEAQLATNAAPPRPPAAPAGGWLNTDPAVMRTKLSATAPAVKSCFLFITGRPPKPSPVPADARGFFSASRPCL